MLVPVHSESPVAELLSWLFDDIVTNRLLTGCALPESDSEGHRLA